MARVSSHAILADRVTVGPYAVVEDNVEIGNDTTVGPYCMIQGPTIIGRGCTFTGYASIGTPPQDHSYRGEDTRLIIGDNNTIREFVTINRGTIKDKKVTTIGNDNLIMAYCHIAHNCKLGNNIIMVNAANLAGHIHVDDYAIIGGLTGVHQFIRIGAHCIIGGTSAVDKDIPPFVTAAGNRARLYGLNIIGLKRRGFKEETIRALKEAYRIVFRSSLLLSVAIEKVKSEVEDIPEVRQFIEFIDGRSARGICR
jgi:UDP-N-acetylglucosamine acyltransferase